MSHSLRDRIDLTGVGQFNSPIDVVLSKTGENILERRVHEESGNSGSSPVSTSSVVLANSSTNSARKWLNAQ
jgi:hypothetical protein